MPSENLQAILFSRRGPNTPTPFSLPKTSLLSEPWEYKRVYDGGRRLRGENFTIVYLSNGLGENRLGISVHGEKSAVRRNRIKRIVREFYRHHRTFTDWGKTGPQPPDTGMDLVFAVRRGFAPESPLEVEQTVRELLGKISLNARPPKDRHPGSAKNAPGQRRS